jgi:hypothetical protein
MTTDNAPRGIPDGMVEDPIVDANDLPSARRLADLVATYQDLEFVSACAHRVLDEQSKGSAGDDVLIEGMWTAALIAYARCFNTGLRSVGLTDDTITEVGLAGDPAGFHRYLRDMRDKHLAHSVNPFERVAVGIGLAHEGAPPAILGVALLRLRLTSEMPETVEHLLGLVDALQLWLGDRIDSQRAAVRQEAEVRDLNELYARPRMKVTAAGPDDAGRARA